MWAATAGGRLSQGGWQVPGSEAARAEALFADRFGEQATSLIVIFTDPDGAADSDDFQATVADAVAPLADEPIVDEILTYADVGDPSFLSHDGAKTFALIRLNEELEAAVDDAEHLAGLVDAPEGVETVVTGIPLVQQEFNEAIERDLVQAELISLPIAMLILLAVFGTVVGAVLPIIIAAIALPSSMAVISLLAGVTEMSIFVTNVATMIGLALSIDYSLFTVSRFREELRHRSVADAVEHTMATVGKAVAISGVAVAIGLSSLTVFESPALRSMGIGGVVTVLSTLVFGLTVLPALLGMLGPRVNRLRVPLPRSLRLVEDDPAAADARRGHGLWGRIAHAVMRRPLLIATPVLLVLVLAGLPFFGIQLSTGGNLDDLPPSASVTGFRILEAEFPGGDANPIEVAVQADDADADRRRARCGLGHRAARLRRRPRGPGQRDRGDQRARPAGRHGRGHLPPARLAARGPASAGGRRDRCVDRPMDRRRRHARERLQLGASGLRRGPRGRGRRPCRPGAGRRCGHAHRRPLVAIARLHGQLHPLLAVRAGHRRRRDRDRPVPDLRLDPAADQGRAHEPAEHHRQLRRAGLDLPGRQSRGAARRRSLRHDHRVDPDPHVRHPLRPLDGLRGVPALPHPRAISRHAATTPAPWRRGSGSPAASSPAPR